jgi:tyrosine-protein kinase Etk/Wzc
VEAHQTSQSAAYQSEILGDLKGGCREPGEISLTELLNIIGRRKATIARVMVVAGLLATAIAFLLPTKFRAEAVILTPQQTQPSLSAMAQLSGLGSAGGLSSLGLLSGLAMRNPADLYIGILESRTIADRLIKNFNLKQVYKDEDFYSARKRLARNTTIKTGRDTLIRILVEDRDPNRAAQLANAYVDELSSQNSRVALTEASQRRLFFETQLSKEKSALADAEIALRDTQQATGLVAPTGQAEGLLRAVSQLHAQISARQAQLEAMKTFASDENPHFQRAKREVSALQTELEKLERGNHVAGTPEVPAGELPQAGLQYLRKYRDVKYHEALFEILAKQYEAARLDEAKSGPMVQVIDRAVPPERKSWPPRGILILTAIALAGLASSFWVLLSESRGPGIA